MIDESYVEGVNHLICIEEGQDSVLLNPGMLSSAIGTQQWFDTIELQITAVYRSIICNHPFKDANKRTAVLVLVSNTTPKVNEDKLEYITLEIAKGNLTDVEEISYILFNLST